MLFAIEDCSGARLSYGADTGPLPSGTWKRLACLGWVFEIVVLDHSNGSGPAGGSHLTGQKFWNEIEHAKALGVMTDHTVVLAIHIAHRYNPPHEELAQATRPLGYGPAYDGLTIETDARS